MSVSALHAHIQDIPFLVSKQFLCWRCLQPWNCVEVMLRLAISGAGAEAKVNHTIAYNNTRPNLQYSRHGHMEGPYRNAAPLELAHVDAIQDGMLIRDHSAAKSIASDKPLGAQNDQVAGVRSPVDTESQENHLPSTQSQSHTAEQLDSMHASQHASCSKKRYEHKSSAERESWDSYVEYIQREVIQTDSDRQLEQSDRHGAAEPHQMLSVRTFSQLRGKKAQEELEAQLARAEAAAGVQGVVVCHRSQRLVRPVRGLLHGAGAKRKQQEQARRKQAADLLKAEIQVAKEHCRLSCLWRWGWRPWRMAVELQKRRLRKMRKQW
jgi:hypothetical protein